MAVVVGGTCMGSAAELTSTDGGGQVEEGVGQREYG